MLFRLPQISCARFSVKQSVRIPSLKAKPKPSQQFEALKYNPIVKRNRMSESEIASVRQKRNKLIALQKRRAAANIAKYKEIDQLPQSTLIFKNKVAQILGSKCINEAHLLELISNPQSELIERQLAQKTASKERLKKIVEAHILQRYTEEDRKQRALVVRLEEEALDQLYQEQIYEKEEYDFDLDIEGIERYDLPEWK